MAVVQQRVAGSAVRWNRVEPGVRAGLPNTGDLIGDAIALGQIAICRIGERGFELEPL